jgi:hypothetical protein
MKLAPVLADEAERLADLKALNILDTPREPRFDRLTDRAADVLDMPMLFVNLVEAERQWFKSTCGLDGVSDTPRDVGFCSHAIHEPELMLVPDASKDERFADNPFVTGALLRPCADPRPARQGHRYLVPGRQQAARAVGETARAAENIRGAGAGGSGVAEAASFASPAAARHPLSGVRPCPSRCPRRPRNRRAGVGPSASRAGLGRFCLSNGAWRTEQAAHAELAPMSVSRADRSGRLEAVPLDSQLFDLRFERLPGYAQLGSSTGRPPDDALRLS